LLSPWNPGGFEDDRAVSRYSVLIADDDRGHREAIADALRDRGLRAHAAESGDRAIDIVRRQVIHVGILDIHMPGLTGIETCRRLREITATLPLILMSAEASMRLDALSAGASSFLAKPLSLRQLLGAVADLLKTHYDVTGLDLG
jgi:CheY-like chemotaxis protein